MPGADREDLRFLSGPWGLRANAAELPADPFRAQTQLRRELSARQARAVLGLRDLRRRAAGPGAAGRFDPELAARLLGTDRMFQQASSQRLASYKADRLAAKAHGEVWDLCCSMGVDALALAARGLDVRAVDRDADALLCLEANARWAGLSERIRPVRADVEALELPASAVVHIDPDRRRAGRRSVRPSAYAPGAAVLRSLPGRTCAGVMKLSAATPWDAVAAWAGLRWEYVEEAGTCKQLLGWWGGAGPGDPLTATAVWDGRDAPAAESMAVDPADACEIRPIGAVLVDPGPAVLAARGGDTLARRFRLNRMAAGLTLLTGASVPRTRLADRFRVLAEVPGRERDVFRAVRELGGGTVEVKPRGLRLDTDRMQRRLRADGDRTLSVFWYRLGRVRRAAVCLREDPSS